MSRIRHWTDEEYAFLLESEDRSAEYVAMNLGRSVQAIYAKRSKIVAGVQEQLIEGWTEEEDALIRNIFHTAPQLSTMLPGRSVTAIQKRRQKIGLSGLAFNKNAYHIGGRPLIAKTCPNCGLLLQAKWFQWDGRKRQWDSSCARCKGRKRKYRGTRTTKSEELRRQHLDFINEFTKKTASRHGFPWLEEDRKILQNPDMSKIEKAIALGRTYRAVDSECSRNGYKSHIGLGDPEHDQWIINNPNAKEYAS